MKDWFSEVYAVADKIRNLEIQGATNIALTSLKVMKKIIKNVDLTKENYKKIYNAIEVLKYARITEPTNRNCLNILENYLNKVKDKKKIIELIDKIMSDIKNSKRRIALIGSRYLEDKSKILTICHSSTVIELLKEAKNSGKNIEVYVPETRPLYQGRLTAKDLLKYKIPVYFFVDNVLSTIINDIDIVIVGSDSILADGSLINKIGTKIVAILAYKYDIPFLVASSIFKVNLDSLYGIKEKIEYRDVEEVWKDAPKGIKIINPAFDYVPSKYISIYITELGLIPPQKIAEEAKKFFENYF